MRGEVVKCFIVYILLLYKVCSCLSLWACEATETGAAPSLCDLWPNNCALSTVQYTVSQKLHILGMLSNSIFVRLLGLDNKPINREISIWI